MLTTAPISLSGMNAARSALTASAHNIANAGTVGLQRDRVSLSTTAGGGGASSLSQAGFPADDLAADIVGQLMAKNHFLMNLAVFKTQDQMLGTLLDATG